MMGALEPFSYLVSKKVLFKLKMFDNVLKIE